MADPTTGDILEQYAYEPYGSLIAAERFNTNLAVNRVGHQGLFFERFEGTFTDAALDQPPPGLPIGATIGLYNNRNRFYHPVLGRFTSRDPNETGIPILTAMAMNGEALSSAFGPFNAQSLYGDGMNLYVFTGNSPVMLTDPLGTEFSMNGTLAAVGTTAYMMWNIYDAATDVRDVFKMFRDNVGWDQILLVAAMNAAFNFGPGNEFEAAYDALTFFKKTVFKGLGKKIGKELAGQLHHAISKRVHKALKDCPNLRGKYQLRDSRFTSKAVDKESHSGYFGWHEKTYDADVVKWLERNKEATPDEFENFLRSYFGSPDMKKRFPMGLGPEDLFK